MARARNLKPSFFTDDEVAELPPLGRLLFQGLWCMADREGRLEDRPKKIKAEIMPYDNCNVEKMLAELAAGRFVIRYEVDGHRFIQVRQFKKHQNPHVKEPASTIPAPDSHGAKHGASTVHAPEKKMQEPEIPARAGLIPDSGFPLPDSSALIPDSGSRLSDPGPPDSGLPQPDSAKASAQKGNGTIEKPERSTAKSTGQDWDDPTWVYETAKTTELHQRANEPYLDFKDRVYAAVQMKLAKAALQVGKRVGR